MPRALWKGAISFGLVNIPVGLYSAEKKNELGFSMLDKRNLAPVGYKRVNKETGREVPWEQVVKGYEYEPDKYVVLSDEDFRRANVEATQTVDIVSFVEAEQIPPIHFESPYYLAPLKRGEKGYVLLRDTLKRSGKAGVANVVIRTRQHLALVAPLDEALVLIVLRYADEIRPVGELGLDETLKAAKPGPKEIDMALRLVEGMSEKWDPKRYRDTYREDILARVEEKVKAGQTEEITEPGEKERRAKGAEVIDLMALLKRSVEEKGGTRAGATGHRRARPGRKAVAKGARAHKAGAGERPRRHASASR
jgi:DNA end-binding protein Ku